MVSQQGSIFGIKCNCLLEMKKDCVYKLEIDITTADSDVCRAHCNCPAGRVLHGSCKHIATTLFTLENFILLTKKLRHLPMIMMCPAHQNYRLGTNQGKGDYNLSVPLI